MKKRMLKIPGNTPVVECYGLFGVKRLFMKDETKNPTHTFKDRLAYEMVRPIAEAIRQGKKFRKTTFISISYGNTAFSMGHYTAQVNRLFNQQVVNAIALVPHTLRERKFGPNTEGKLVSAKKILKKIEKNCQLIEIDLTKRVYQSCDLEKIARAKGNVLDQFVDIMEGLDRPAYVNIIIEAIEHQLKSAPDYVIVPFGAGILCNEIIDYIQDHKLKTKVIPVSSGDPDTIAVMLYGVIWVDVESLRKKGYGWTKHQKVDKKGRARKQYKVYHVSDKEMLSAMKILHQHRLSAEASGSVGFAILPRLKKIDPKFNPKKHSVLVINTGNGLLNYT